MQLPFPQILLPAMNVGLDSVRNTLTLERCSSVDNKLYGIMEVTPFDVEFKSLLDSLDDVSDA
jgi:hypothetical protein